jgi:hypothetical protein
VSRVLALLNDDPRLRAVLFIASRHTRYEYGMACKIITSRTETVPVLTRKQRKRFESVVFVCTPKTRHVGRV